MTVVRVLMDVWPMDDEDAQDVRRFVIAAMGGQLCDYQLYEPARKPPHVTACDRAPCDDPREPVSS